jgi:hypothetical protein
MWSKRFVLIFLMKNMKWHLVSHKRLKFQFEG